MDYQVTLNFNDGDKDFDLPLVQSVSDSVKGIKATVIEGTRGDGAIVIPGGKKSTDIVVEGILVEKNQKGYKSLTEQMQELESNITTKVATLTLKHYYDGEWFTDWAYTVRRIDKIEYVPNLRIRSQEYSINFKILAY